MADRKYEGGAEETYQKGLQNMDQYDRDLNPDGLAGRNVDMQGPHPETDNPPTAYDVKEIHNKLQGFEDDELRSIPIMPEGSRLEQGAVYIDLMQDQPREFKAMGDMTAGRNNAYVPKANVDYVLWNRLIGVQNPERLDQADERP